MKYLVNGAGERLMIIHFVRDVPGDKMRDNFVENMQEQMTPAEIEASKAEMERLGQALSQGVKEGQRVEFGRTDRGVRITHGGTLVFESQDKVLMRALFAVYFGKDPVVEDLVDSIKSGLKQK